MWTAAIVVADEFLYDSAQVSRVGGNEIVQAFAPDSPDQPLAIGIRFGSLNRRSERPHAKAA